MVQALRQHGRFVVAALTLTSIPHAHLQVPPLLLRRRELHLRVPSRRDHRAVHTCCVFQNAPAQQQVANRDRLHHVVRLACIACTACIVCIACIVCPGLTTHNLLVTRRSHHHGAAEVVRHVVRQLAVHHRLKTAQLLRRPVRLRSALR